MPWTWLDAGVQLEYEGERQVEGTMYDVVKLTFDASVGVTAADEYWAFVSKETGRMERWEFAREAGGQHEAYRWSGWQDAGGGLLLSTRKEGISPDADLVIEFPVAAFVSRDLQAIFNPILRPSSNELPPTEPTGTPPAKAGAHELLIVLNKSDHTAAFLHGTNLEIVRTVPTGVAPHEAAVSRDGRKLYVANYGAKSPGHTITEIDIPKGEVIREVDLGENKRPHGLVVGPDGSIWVTTEESQSVLRLSPADLSLQAVYKTGQETTHMIALTPDGKRAFTANIGSGSITVIDVDGGVVRSIETGAGAEGIAITPDGKEVWVTNREEDSVTILDTESLRRLGRISTSSYPIRVQFTPDGKLALVSCAHANELMVFDVATRDAVDTVRLADVPVGIQISPDGKYAFVASTQADRVAMVDLAKMRVVGAFFSGREPDGMTWSSW